MHGMRLLSSCSLGTPQIAHLGRAGVFGSVGGGAGGAGAGAGGCWYWCWFCVAMAFRLISKQNLNANANIEHDVLITVTSRARRVASHRIELEMANNKCGISRQASQIFSVSEGVVTLCGLQRFWLLTMPKNPNEQNRVCCCGSACMPQPLAWPHGSNARLGSGKR